MFNGHGFGGVSMWFLWILLIVFVVWMVKAMVSAGRDDRGLDEAPLEILRDRFARGEIDEEEFEQKRKLLDR